MPTKVHQDSTIGSDEVKFAIRYFGIMLDRPNSIQLFQTIVDRAQGGNDPDFTQSFLKWLQSDGGTLVLRDELCYPYRRMFDDQKEEGKQDLAWDNAWNGIDSVKLRYREEFRVGSFSPVDKNENDRSSKGMSL